jgi:hypothetical protein
MAGRVELSCVRVQYILEYARGLVPGTMEYVRGLIVGTMEYAHRYGMIAMLSPLQMQRALSRYE